MQKQKFSAKTANAMTPKASRNYNRQLTGQSVSRPADQEKRPPTSDQRSQTAENGQINQKCAHNRQYAADTPQVAQLRVAATMQRRCIVFAIAALHLHMQQWQLQRQRHSTCKYLATIAALQSQSERKKANSVSPVRPASPTANALPPHGCPAMCCTPPSANAQHCSSAPPEVLSRNYFLVATEILSNAKNFAHTHTHILHLLAYLQTYLLANATASIYTLIRSYTRIACLSVRFREWQMQICSAVLVAAAVS